MPHICEATGGRQATAPFEELEGLDLYGKCRLV